MHLRQLSQISIKDTNIPQVKADSTAVTSILKYIFVTIGAISVLMIFIGGIRYIVSTGDPQRTATAKNTILYAVIGLIISISAFAIVEFIIRWL